MPEKNIVIAFIYATACFTYLLFFELFIRTTYTQLKLLIHKTFPHVKNV